MPVYTYLAQTSGGSIERGTMRESSRLEVQNSLAKSNSRLIGIEEQPAESSSALDRRKDTLTTSLSGLRPIRSVDIELMLLQLSVMLSSGLELQPALKELAEHCPNRRMQSLYGELTDAIENGDSFSTALASSNAFTQLVVQLAEIGESSGDLSRTLRRASEAMERRRQSKGALMSALAYPFLVAISASCVAVYLVGWAIPKLAKFLDAMGRKLPPMTQSLLDISTWINTYSTMLGVVAVAIAATIGLCYRWPPGRYKIDQGLLRIPLFGNLFRMIETQQLAASLSLLLHSGVFLQDALVTAAKLQHNQHLKLGLNQTRKQISMGHGFSASLHDKGFGDLLSSMIAVGERTGDLPSTLEHVGEFYEGQVETQRKRIERLIEPAIIVVVGGLVGYVYAAFFMALMSAGGNFN